MQTKLTLRLEDQLIANAKAHAKNSGKSLSQMVADYFALLEKKTPIQELPPVTSSLKGCLQTSSVDEQDYRIYLEDKYL